MYKGNYILGIIVSLLLFGCRKETTLGEYPYQTDKEPLDVKLSTEALRPAINAPGTTVTLFGEGFTNYKKEDLIIRFNGEPAEILNVTDTRLDVKVPTRASSGLITLTINKQVLAGPKHQISGAVSVDPNFKSFPGVAGGVIKNVRFLDDGKFLLTGNFNDYDNSGEADGLVGMARTNSDGSVDRTFKTRRGFAGGTVNDALPIDGGRYLVAGSFSNYRNRFRGGVVQNMITLNNDGSADSMIVSYPSMERRDTLPKFNIAFDNTVVSLHRQGDGKIIVIGNFRRVYVKKYGALSADGRRDSVIVDTLPINFLARLNTDLTIDTTYNFQRGLPTGKLTVNGDITAALVTGGDQLIIAGSFTTFNNAAAPRLARLDTLGNLDASFNVGSGPDNTVSSIAQLSDGRIIASGLFLNVAGKSLKKLALFTATGALDAGFDPQESAVGNISMVKVLDNGKILISGFFDNFQSYRRDGIAIIDANGMLSSTHNNFGGFTNGFVLAAAAVTARNSIVLTGGFNSFDLKSVSGIVKLSY